MSSYVNHRYNTRSSGKRTKTDSSSKQVCHIDRLSDLPDELLTRIRSFLSTKDVAVTTLLSTRFKRAAFAFLTNLELDDSPISYCSRNPVLVERTLGFKKFVDKVLQSCQSETLGSFRFRFGRFHGDEKRYVVGLLCKGRGCYPDLEPARLNAWVSYPLARGVKELDLCINVNKSRECCKLPRSIFLCETLQMLRIDSNLDLDIAFPIRLPHLKLLHLRSLLFTNDETVTELVKSCPVLEDLLVDCYWDRGDLLTISSPCLLKLDLYFNKCKRNKQCNKVVLDTPNLRSFKYRDYIAAASYIITEMPDLVQAEISMMGELFLSEESSCSSLCTILKSCTTVSHLSLLFCSPSCLGWHNLKHCLPVFPNLNHLELGCSSLVCWDKVLVELLESCPSLETLVFPQGIGENAKDEKAEAEQILLERECWEATRKIPLCCKSHFKKVAIKGMFADLRERYLVEFLLKNALVLESLVLLLPAEEVDPKFETSLQNTFDDFRKASASCSLILSREP